MEPIGDIESYEQFFRSIEPTLRRLGYAYTGNSEQAHDLAQETLVRAWQRWPHLSRHAHPEAWCRTVLRNLATSRWRRMRLERAHLARPPVPTTGASDDQPDVLAALRKLPAKQQQALILHDVEGFTAEEIAMELGATPGTVRSWLSRGRQSLAQDLAASFAANIDGGRP